MASRAWQALPESHKVYYQERFEYERKVGRAGKGRAGTGASGGAGGNGVAGADADADADADVEVSADALGVSRLAPGIVLAEKGDGPEMPVGEQLRGDGREGGERKGEGDGDEGRIDEDGKGDAGRGA